ncbi:copper amine oxidase [Cohnella lupini]|uniref:Copper amine oxidase-like protein n=1 Tax=Cohnella lupini TaxID=1294267 RepID=A0A3D9IWH1_9BACL|nr:copper amine oxidase [Cohnella lupini]RED65849.1 hypothetical protein DFP95_101345 [Cohnella lupini]
MKVRKLALLTLALTLICGGVAYADTVSQKLRVLVVNKKSESYNGIIVDNKVYVPVDLITDKLQGIVITDETDNKVTIYKPNVHMVTSKNKGIFGDVEKGAKVDFFTHIQVDSLKVDINALKLTIVDPYGEETLIESRKAGDSDFPERENIWMSTKEFSYTFSSTGTYTLRFYVKPVGQSSFQVISEKSIASK